jgi:hypothetical protein
MTIMLILFIPWAVWLVINFLLYILVSKDEKW